MACFATRTVASEGVRAGLVARERTQPAVKRTQLSVERVDHGQREGDLLARGDRQWLGRQPRAAADRQQLAALWAPVVIQDRLDALLPLTALMRQRVTQPDLGPKIQQMIVRDPGLWQPSDRQYGGQVLLQRLERETPTTTHIAFSQNPNVMSGAAMGFAELISTGKLRHPNQADLNSHVLAASAKFVGERWRFVKPPGRQHVWIDACVAATIACDVLGRYEPPRVSVYQDRIALFGKSPA